jgi:predicted negative regulator of RcsB-dependent stress response
MAGPYDLEEQERIAAIKNWWEDNARYVYAAIAAVVIAVAGWRGWEYWNRVQSEEASALAQELGKARGDAKKAGDIAQALADKYPRTFYASEGALLAARAAFDAGDLEAARARLDWVVKNGRDVHKGVARLRLAAVLLDQKKPKEALEVLDASTEPAFAALAADLRGDIHFSQGRLDEARAAYKLAIEKGDARSPTKSLTELKLGALGGTP